MDLIWSDTCSMNLPDDFILPFLNQTIYPYLALKLCLQTSCQVRLKYFPPSL